MTRVVKLWGTLSTTEKRSCCLICLRMSKCVNLRMEPMPGLSFNGSQRASSRDIVTFKFRVLSQVDNAIRIRGHNTRSSLYIKTLSTSNLGEARN